MSLLSALTQKRKARQAATAIPAISATQPMGEAGTVAKIAALAVANPSEAKSTNTATSRGWLLYLSDRDPLEVYCNPDASHAAILERYPDALAAEPIPERTRRNPTEAEVEGMQALVQAIGKTEQWNDGDFEWAMAAALADPDGALTSYQATAVENGIILPLDDDRRTCDQCVNLARRRCLVAWRGEIVANRDYKPVRDIPRRCEGYAPGTGDPDKRPGLERWPE